MSRSRRRKAKYVRSMVSISAEALHLPELPLALLPEELIRPSRESLDEVMAGFA